MRGTLRRGVMRQAISRLRSYAHEVLVYAREAEGVRDFAAVMRVRLSLSKLGHVACPRPIVARVRLRSLGGEVLLRSHTSDISVLGEVIVSKIYGVAARAAGPKTRTIVDLGANTGLAARWLLHRFPDARVVCVEPQSGNVVVLRENLAGLESRAEILEACVGARDRLVTMVGSPGAESAFAMVDDPNGDVRVVTMQAVVDVLGTGRIDLLKCDIEGAEKELFEASSAWIEDVGAIAVECHGDFTLDRLTDLLRSYGQVPEVLDHRPNPAYDCEHGVLLLSTAA